MDHFHHVLCDISLNSVLFQKYTLTTNDNLTHVQWIGKQVNEKNFNINFSPLFYPQKTYVVRFSVMPSYQNHNFNTG